MIGKMVSRANARKGIPRIRPAPSSLQGLFWKKKKEKEKEALTCVNGYVLP